MDLAKTVQGVSKVFRSLGKSSNDGEASEEPPDKKKRNGIQTAIARFSKQHEEATAPVGAEETDKLRGFQRALSMFKKQQSDNVESEEEKKERAVIQVIMDRFRKNSSNEDGAEREEKGRSVSMDFAMLKNQTKRWKSKLSKKSKPPKESATDEDKDSPVHNGKREALEEEEIIFDDDESDDGYAQCNRTFEYVKGSKKEEEIWGMSVPSTIRNPENKQSSSKTSDDMFTSLESLNDRLEPPENKEEEEEWESTEIHICMEPEDTRFGFSVIGGQDEGISIQIDEIKEGSPADKADLEVGDEILEVNGRSMEEATHGEVISHIHQCIRSRTICLRVKRRSGNRLAADFNSQNNVQDAFVIAVEQQARERLERLSALKRIKPVDMTKLSHQLNQIPLSEHQKELNGFIEKSPIYVTSFSTSEQGSEKIVSAVRGPDDDTEPELELTQDIEGADTDGELVADTESLARTSSPFVNGRTEVLIGQENTGPVRTAVSIENNRLAVEDPEAQLRPRRRSGSSIVVVGDEPIKYPPREEDLEDVRMMMTMLDSGPHRELPVDVPDSFIATSKTPPRYPPPKTQVGGSMNGSAKPVPPPRDHLRIEKDGRLTNRLPAPQVPARTVSSVPPINNNVPREQPTKQELEAIRKFEEELRQRKEEEERLAKQHEFLKGSLRGSKKLHALESHPPAVGVINDGYSDEELSDSSKHGEVIHKIIGYGELVAALQRLQHHLKRVNAPGLSGVENQLASVQGVLLSPQFGRALSVCNKVQEVSLLNENQCLPGPQHWPVQQLLRDCIQILEPCTLPEATELSHLLSSYEMEGLLQAHDTIASGAVVSLDDLGPSQRNNKSPGPEAVVETPYAGIKVVKIEKTNEPLGATVRNDGDAVVIGRVVKGGAAEKSGLLHEGDEVLQVNGVDMRGKSIHDVCDILAGMVGTLTFIIIPGHTPKPSQSTQNTLMHMKAHFDYDPEDDAYIPCKELGISFQKGDVLHVISQDDSNWWQAYREGEEDQILAGLIPSASFQHQRESLKQQIAGDRFNKDKNKKASTLLCAKKHKKKKKKKTPYTAYNDGSYPLYSTAVDDYDADEILTYEEVALYYPRSNRKRPIVLIGPPNIGRHELRQRLMEDSERFAAAIPHTSRPRKESEIDGQDYHFISRAQFEADILARRFVEHGEYEKAYYGTSLEAIRAVVNSGKICVLNLHPQSLKILRNSDLKPYVVFVAPPSLERLRQKKIKNGESYKEEELKDIIEKAREMEDKYGHFLDMIIINNDTERAFQQLQNEISSLEREPQWVPAAWVKAV